MDKRLLPTPPGGHSRRNLAAPIVAAVKAFQPSYGLRVLPLPGLRVPIRCRGGGLGARTQRHDIIVTFVGRLRPLPVRTRNIFSGPTVHHVGQIVLHGFRRHGPFAESNSPLEHQRGRVDNLLAVLLDFIRSEPPERNVGGVANIVLELFFTDGVEL
jgi:hypothetical protein